VFDVLDGAEQAVADDLGRLPRSVRGADHVRQGEDRVVRGQRLLVEDVGPGPEDLAVLEGGQERVAVHECPAPRVDEDGRRLDQRELFPAEGVPCLGAQAEVEAHGTPQAAL
jgi:hypothetical protein